MDLKAQIMRRFSEGKADDAEVNRDLAWMAMGAFMQKEETDLVVSPEDLDRIEAIKKTIANIDPNKENP